MKQSILTAGLYWVLLLVLVVLSWLLLFRDERVLQTFGAFYPNLTLNLWGIRRTLLHSGLNSVFTAVFALAGLGMFWLYWGMLRSAISRKGAIIFAVILLLTCFFSYPVLSSDIFDYILSDRQALVFRSDIWSQSPAAVIPASDRFFPLASWQNQTNPYGTVNQFFYSLAGILSGNDLIQSLFFHKLLILVVSLGLLGIFYKSGFSAENILIVFANPLWLLETVGSGHNDILMLFFLVAALVAWRKGRLISAGICLALAAQVKFIPLLLMPFLLAHLLRQNLRRALVFLSVVAVTFSLTFIPIIPDVWQFVHRQIFGGTILWQSLSASLSRGFPQARSVLGPLFLFWFALRLIRLFRQQIDPLEAFSEIIFVFLVLVTSVYWSWYCLWLLVLVPFISSSSLVRPVLTLTLTSFIIYPLYWLGLRLGYQNSFWPVIIYLVLAAPPLGVYFASARNSQTIPG